MSDTLEKWGKRLSRVTSDRISIKVHELKQLLLHINELENLLKSKESEDCREPFPGQVVLYYYGKTGKRHIKIPREAPQLLLSADHNGEQRTITISTRLEGTRGAFDIFADKGKLIVAPSSTNRILLQTEKW